MVIGNDNISPSRIEIRSPDHLEYKIEKDKSVKNSEGEEDQSKNSDKSSDSKSNKSHNKGNNCKRDARRFYDRKIVGLNTHAKLIRTYPIIEIKSSFIDLLFDFIEGSLFGVFFSKCI